MIERDRRLRTHHEAITPHSVIQRFILWSGAVLCLCAACSAPSGSVRRQEPSGSSGTSGVSPTAGEAAVPEPSPSASAQDADSEVAGLPVTGLLSARYRYRSDGTDDHDLSSTLLLNIGDERRHAVTGHVLAWANGRLDGRSDGDDAFSNINDTYSSDLQARLYEAYADLHRIDELDVARLGRQPLYDTPEYVTFDGVRLETRSHGEHAWRFGAYGGVPVHHFESSSSGDSVVGAYVEARPWAGGRARLDYMYLEDEQRLGDAQNDLLGARLWQLVGTRLRLEGAFSALEGESRDVLARATWFDVEDDIVVRASYYELLETQSFLVHEFDPFYDTLFEYFPYSEIHGLVSKGFCERYRAELGLQSRRLKDSGDEGDYNHEFDRYFARFIVEDFLTEALILGLTADHYDADGDDYSAFSADLEKAWNERWNTAIGTYYALYRFDFFEDRERTDVRVYFADIDYDVSKSTRFGLRYEYEDDENDDYHVVKVGTTWRF